MFYRIIILWLLQTCGFGDHDVGGHGPEHLGKQLSRPLTLENKLNMSKAAVTSRNEVPRLTLPFSMVYTCQLLPDTEIELINSKYFLPLHAPPKQGRKKKKKRRYVISRFQRPLGKPLNHLIQTTPSVNFKVKTFHWVITFRFDISLLPCHTHQVAERQSDSGKNEIESYWPLGTFLVSGCAQLLVLCLWTSLLTSYVLDWAPFLFCTPTSGDKPLYETEQLLPQL